MPEARFVVRWPDGDEESCYSPSLVIHDHLVAGRRYPVEEFVTRTTAAMQEASERVRARYGTACTGAAATSSGVRARAASYHRGDVVDVLSIQPPLPGAP